MSQPALGTNFDTVEYLLRRKQDGITPIRKRSQFPINQVERQNFVLRHQSAECTVVRGYIDSEQQPQIKLYHSKFIPIHKIGTICIIPGYGQNSDDYVETAVYFAKQGFVVNMIDLRGFGYSGGCRVNASISGLMSDITILLSRCCNIGLPTYIMAHGYGSLLVFALLQQNPNLPIAGVISLSPLFTLPFFNNWLSFKSKILFWLLSTFCEDLLINNMINPTSLTNNPKKIKKCIDGVFNYQFISVKMAKQYSNLCHKVMRDAQKFKYPLIICYGGQNMIQSKSQVRKYYKRVGSRQKSSFVYGKGYHQLYNDQKVQIQIFPKILQWIQDEHSNKNKTKWTRINQKLNIYILKSVEKAHFSFLFLIISILILFIRRIKKK